MKASCRLTFAIVLSAVSLCAESPVSAKFNSANRQISYEIFGAESSGPLLIMLHGASGPGVPLYRSLAQTFATENYTVLFLHYFDATNSSRASGQNYLVWERAVSDLVQHCKTHPDWSKRRIAILGFSLGASVALAAGSQRVPVDAVAEWYGSLPDEFFYKLKGMPPLLILHGAHDDNIPVNNAQQIIQLCGMQHYRCESHIYPDQGHGFLPPDFNEAVKRTLDFFARQMK